MTRSRWILSCFAVVVLGGGLAMGANTANTPVEELTKVMPDNIVAFFATSGCDAVKDDFAKSSLGRMWNDPSMQQFVSSIKTELLSKAKDEAGEDFPQFAAAALQYAQLVLSRPVMIGMTTAEVEEGPPMAVFAIIDAGNRKADFVAALEQLEQAIGKDEIADIQIGSLKMRGSPETEDLSVYWGWVGNYLVAAANDQQKIVTWYLSNPRSAAATYLDKVPGYDDALAVYYDYSKLLGLLEAIAPNEEALGSVRAAVAELGVANFGPLVARAGFSGPDVVSNVFMAAPEPRKGVLALDRPIDPSIFGLVDGRAMGAGAFNFDFAGMYDVIMNTLQKISPDEIYPAVQEKLGELESEFGFDIRKDLLGTLAGTMVGYSLPAGTMIEAPMGGAVGIVELTDAARFEQTMSKVGELAASMANGMLQVGQQEDESGRVIHVWTSPVLAMAQMTPTWCVVDNHLVIGSNMALCQMGIERATSGGQSAGSLLEAEGFKKVASQLPKNLLSLSYADSQVQMTQMLTQLQQVWPMAVMAAAQQKVKLPVMLPALGPIVKEMEPSCEYSYATADGFYSHYQGSGVEMSLKGVAGAALGAGVMMPALARTRQLAERMVSGTNLSGIGKACLIYANDHDDEFPPNLEALVETVDLSPKSLVSKFKPAGSDEPSYIYIAGQTTSMDPRNVIAYDNPAFCTEGVNVLFLDSHVEFMKPDGFRKVLEATYRRLGREMPEIEFAD